jgi:hypothetical protein
MGATWKVLEHGPLVQLADNLWWVDGEVPRMALRRACTIARRDDGGLVVHSAICLDEPTQAAVEGLGPIAHVIVPNHFHRIDAPRYAARYPDARIVAPRGGRSKIADVVRVDLTADAFPNGDDVAVLPFDGTHGQENVLRVRSEDGVTLVFNDALFNVPHRSGFGGLVLRAIGSSGGPKATPIARFGLYKDKPTARACLEALAETPDLVRVIPGHGDIIRDDPAGVLRAVAGTL